jgi:hypothetical protein
MLMDANLYSIGVVAMQMITLGKYEEDFCQRKFNVWRSSLTNRFKKNYIGA